MRGLFFVCGTISLILGSIGIFLPVLPTTPFLLLSAFCYARSSKKMHKWLLENRFFGKYIYNYVHYKAIDKRTKICALIFLWCTLLISVYFMNNIYIRILLFIVGVCVSAHILILKTLKIERE